MLPKGFPFFSIFLTYYSLVWNACVVAVKCHPVLHHYVVIFVWSSELIYGKYFRLTIFKIYVFILILVYCTSMKLNSWRTPVHGLQCLQASFGFQSQIVAEITYISGFKTIIEILISDVMMLVILDVKKIINYDMLSNWTRLYDGIDKDILIYDYRI